MKKLQVHKEEIKGMEMRKGKGKEKRKKKRKKKKRRELNSSFCWAVEPSVTRS